MNYFLLYLILRLDNISGTLIGLVVVTGILFGIAINGVDEESSDGSN